MDDINHLFVNDNNSSFQRARGLFLLQQGGFTLAESVIFVRIKDAWLNILTGSIINDVVSPISAYDVVLDTDRYTDALTEGNYNEILL